MKTISSMTKTLQQMIIAVLAMAAFTFNTYAQGDNASLQGRINFKETVIDYGTIEKGTDGNRSFTFTNVGDAPVVIASVKASCGCTVPTKPKGPIMPGESAQIGVKYDTSRLGAFTKKITVLSNADTPNITLKIVGVVVDPKNKLGQ